jgi:hypothetical protein
MSAELPSLQLLVDTWSSTKANGYLSKAAPFPLPSQGPLHELLVTTKRLLPDPKAMNKQSAHDAITTGAALVIAKLASWLQQQPYKFMMRQSLNMHLWLLLTRFIQSTLSNLAPAVGELPYQLLHQLVASGESCTSYVPT